MQFLNPVFLLALAAVAAPLLVHIFSVRRVPEVEFSSLMFLKSARRRSMRRINLRRLLLLFLRMMLVALVAMAFARPVIRGRAASLFPGSLPVARVILIDRSYSMGLKTREGELFEIGVEAAKEIAARSEDDDLLAVIAFDEEPESIFRGAGGGKEYAVEALDGLEVSWRSTDLRKAAKMALDVLAESGYQARELYIISDLQRSSVGGGKGVAEGSEKTPGAAGAGMEEKGRVYGAGKGKGERLKVRTLMIPVEAEGLRNAAAARVSTPAVAVHPGEAAALEIELRGSSSMRPLVTVVSVMIEGERAMTREVEVPASGVKVIKAPVTMDSAGWIRGEVRLADDRLSFDNRRFFALEVLDRVKVLYLAGKRGGYLRNAVSPGGEDGGVMLIEPGSAGVSSAHLKEADVVVVAPGWRYWGEDIDLLNKFMIGGGGALVFVRPGLEEAVRGISRYQPRVISRARPGEPFTIREPGRGLEFLKPFSGEDLKSLSRLDFRDSIMVRGVGSEDRILDFKDGSPFLWRENIGEGSAVFVAANPEPEGGQLVLSPFFLPLVRQAIASLAAAGGSARDIEVGTGFVIKGDRSAKLTGYFAGDAGGADGSYLLRESPVEAAGFSEGLNAGPFEKPGFVTVERGGELEEVVSVNPDCLEESALEYMSAEEAADSLGLEGFAPIDPEGELDRQLMAATRGREVTELFIWAAVAVFILEALVAQGGAVGRKRRVE